MAKKNKTYKFQHVFHGTVLVPVAVLSVLIVTSIFLLVFYYLTQNIILLFTLLGIIILLGSGFVTLVFFAISYLYKVFYHGLYEVTRHNMKVIAEGRTDFETYPKSNIEEIEELNRRTIQTKDTLENAYLVTCKQDFSSLSLEYIDEDKHLITFESFKDQLTNLIFLSQSFRNVVIEVFYDMNEGELTLEQREYLLKLYFRSFSDYENSLFTFRDNNRSLLIYLPIIDSFSRINEILFMTIKESSITHHTLKGIENIPARFVVVAYPYSSEDSILSDLRYAKRQNKVIHFFLPNRTKNNVDQQVLMHTSMNINYMSRLMASLSELHPFSDEIDIDKPVFRTLLNDLIKYLDINAAGIILFKEEVRKYYSYLSTDDSFLFKEGKEVPNDFVLDISKDVDEDNSYYFSKRSHANQVIGKALDYQGVYSGFYYVIRRDENVIGLIYFFNKEKTMVLDAYLRESLFILSLRISHYFESIYVAQKLELAKNEADYVLAISKYALYRVDEEYNVTDFSPNLKLVFPDVKLGEPCYKCLFGLDKPCHDCLMKNFKKKVVETKKGTLQLSLTMNDRKNRNRVVLVERAADNKEVLPDLYNKDLLVYSFASLVNSMTDQYYAKGRGYLLLLSIDNYEGILEQQGSEGLTFVIRSFIRKIKKKLRIEDVYYYNPSVIAVLFPNIGHADVITKCEQIYDLSKGHYVDNATQNSLNITYLPLSYPRGYATESDFLRHVSDFYYSNNYEKNKDFIYFFDHSISRSASKRDFMLSVIENEFSGKMSTSVNLQPMVVADTGKIYGAEILLRINDVHRNVFFSAQDIARIALQENKTYLITESIVNYVGELFKEHGNSTFKINEFKRVAINIDQTYFKDPGLIKKIIEIHNKYKLPNNFLSFEVPEEMIPENLDKIKNFAKELSDIHIIFSCDRYSGQYVGIEKLKELGFKEIKVMKGVIDGIDKDPVKLNSFKQIADTAKQAGLGISVVGVENEAQYNLLKGIDPKMLLQGFYFYKPLTRSDLLSAIISYD